MTKAKLRTVPWFNVGLKFKCTECGKCCTGKPGYVFVTPEEVAQMADYLKVSVEKFALSYLRQVNGKFSLKEKQFNDCIFLEKNKCQLYDARPIQCKTFPWWPQNLKNKKAWLEAKSECEGIDHIDGKSYEEPEISKELALQIKLNETY